MVLTATSTVGTYRDAMAGVGQLGRRLRRLPLLAWVGALAIVLVGLTATLGGFAEAPDHGRPVGPGEEILLTRWRVHIDRATLIDETYDGQQPDPRIRLEVRLEFTGEQTECCLTDGVLEVRYAGRTQDNVIDDYGEPRSILGFDPGVVASHVLLFQLEPVELPAPVPDRVAVVVRDERPSRSPIWTGWQVSHAVASVDLPCPDERRRR
jgi:hypothetical protein